MKLGNDIMTFGSVENKIDSEKWGKEWPGERRLKQAWEERIQIWPNHRGNQGGDGRPGFLRQGWGWVSRIWSKINIRQESSGKNHLDFSCLLERFWIPLAYIETEIKLGGKKISILNVLSFEFLGTCQVTQKFIFKLINWYGLQSLHILPLIHLLHHRQNDFPKIQLWPYYSFPLHFSLAPYHIEKSVLNSLWDSTIWTICFSGISLVALLFRNICFR